MALVIRPVYAASEEVIVEQVEVAAVEAEQVVEKVAEKVVDAQEEVAEEPAPVDIVKLNPNNCNHDTQWIWADGSCHDKQSSTPTTNVTSQSATHPIGCENYRHLIEQYDWDVSTMMYAMQKESSCNPNAVGDQYVIGGVYAPSCGLLQVRTLPGRPSCDALKDPATNVATAYQIWLGQGYRAWTVLH